MGCVPPLELHGAKLRKVFQLFASNRVFLQLFKCFWRNEGVAVVAVLQFPNRFYDSQKLTLYLYINIEVFLGYGNSFKRTATLQHCNSFCQYIQGWKKYRRKMKNFLWSIREPQWKIRTFAVSNWRSGQAVFKGKNCEG